MEENRIETPLSEVDSNVNTVGDISTEEANQAANEVEATQTSTTVDDENQKSEADEEATQKAQELMELLSDPNVMRAYRASRRVGERRQVSKKENKKKKAKRRMAKKSKR
jgi:uncharacterized protein (UPF0218 family)